MSRGTTDDHYIEWLYSHVGAVSNKNPSRTWWKLFRQLYSIEFVWLIANDDNRVADGLELRDDFIEEYGPVPEEWRNMGCSFLEMLIALARRVSYQTDVAPDECFWIMLDNIGLRRLNDKVFTRAMAVKVTEIVETVIYRTYNPNGHGGLFPQRSATNDQRRVELWYQMSEWVIDNYFD